MKLKHCIFATVATALIVPVFQACSTQQSETGGIDSGAASPSHSVERIKVDGSSTVAPITSAVGMVFDAYRIASSQAPTPVTVGISGTGGGFEKFCTENGTDISNASRTIEEEEIKMCADAGVEYIEIEVATDALSIVVNNKNITVEEISLPELTQMWQKDSEIKTWRELRSDWPDQEIEFFRPGDDSGTFDYFKEAILTVKVDGETIKNDVRVTGSNNANRVIPSEDDTTLIEGIEGSEGAIGFFGFAYYKNNQERIKTLKIAKEADGEAYEPSEANVNAKTYPLARPLFIYVNKASYERQAVKELVSFYLALLMVDAGGTPTGVNSEIIDFINTSDETDVVRARDQKFLTAVGYVSKTSNEYAVELKKLD
ncbi:MAG: phosphate ABC transporter substrate-binding protein PstS family protein [Spirulina sp. SIO3F2]|nr:phosphate ABC transporter substrate-binding protein PstS family protein [Spirulina sp. SIO3F2]